MIPDPMPEVPVREGEVLAGKYRVERVIGQGGMGVVVAAQHLQLGKRVAVKFLLPQVCKNQEAVGRFLREAQAAVQIESEHVARVVDVGTLESGSPYMVMEFLVGSDLAQVLRARGPLPIDEAVDYVLQACEAIAEAHALGIVHRDLKPANLFLVQRKDGSPLVKVLDFGISKVTWAGEMPQPSMTATSAVMGSPQYMSPEQMRSSKNVDGRTDIWALGAILYELLAGRPVYEADTLPGLCAMIATDPPPPLRARRPEVPEQLEAVLLRCLAKEPSQRLHDLGELATALLAFGRKGSRLSVERTVRVIQGAGLSASALALPPSSDRVQDAATVTSAAWGNTTGPGKRRSRPLIWVVVAGLIAVGSLAVFLWFELAGPRPSAAADSVVASSVPASADSAAEPAAAPLVSVAAPSLEPDAVTEDAEAPTQPAPARRAPSKAKAGASASDRAEPPIPPPEKKGPGNLLDDQR